jgi:hypothetical protein
MIDRPTDARRLARDIATNLDRRRRRRKTLVVVLLIAAIIAAVLYLGFGRGFGFGKGSGTASGTGTNTTVATADARPARCALRVTAEGITVDGRIATQGEAVDACKAIGSADVVVTGDARQGAWDELRGALEAAGVAVYQKGGAATPPPQARDAQ